VTITVDTPQELKGIIVDGGIFMDSVPSNNIWENQ
jgi:hypothetical protein